MEIFTCPHIGIFLNIAGTALLAYSLKMDTQYSGDKFMENIIKRMGKNEAFIPTRTYIEKWRFRGGLVLIAIGSIFQW